MTTDAVLVLAYGTPRDLDEVEAYYTHIRHGRPPDPGALEDLRERYRLIGGRSPLLDITLEQAGGLSQRLDLPVFVGQKHAAPFIADAVAHLAEHSIDRAIGLVMAPHYSAMSVGEYEREIVAAANLVGWGGRLDMIKSWHLLEGWVDLQANFVRAALASIPEMARQETAVVFTAHSLPKAILRTGDPYPRQLEESADAIASRAELSAWRVAWQSVSETGRPWLGPDLLQVMVDLAGKGAKGIVVCPCGFVADHLEILYDVDIQARDLADELGLSFARTESPNEHPDFLGSLTRLLRATLKDKVRL
ncbi:MAG: ferrochelatase [Actinomycetota bacterium]